APALQQLAYLLRQSAGRAQAPDAGIGRRGGWRRRGVSTSAAAGVGARAGGDLLGVRQGHAYPENAAVAQPGLQANGVLQQLAQPVHNRQAQAGAALMLAAGLQTAELFKNLLVQALGDAGALVV